jgi:hypothetical protein
MSPTSPLSLGNATVKKDIDDVEGRIKRYKGGT